MVATQKTKNVLFLKQSVQKRFGLDQSCCEEDISYISCCMCGVRNLIFADTGLTPDHNTPLHGAGERQLFRLQWSRTRLRAAAASNHPTEGGDRHDAGVMARSSSSAGGRPKKEAEVLRRRVFLAGVGPDVIQGSLRGSICLPA